MTKTLVLTITCMLMGCKSLPTYDSSTDFPTSLAEAEKRLEAGEFYQAKKITQQYLATNPEAQDATELMARILDAELSRQKEVFETAFSEELTELSEEQEIRTWLERGRALFELGEYDQATAAVENIFQYNPVHPEASALLDQIKNQAIRQSKQEAADYSEIIHTEIETRTAQYKRQAHTWIKEGRPGAAKLAVEKILIMKPEDQEALNLLKQIKEQQRKNHESGAL